MVKYKSGGGQMEGSPVDIKKGIKSPKRIAKKLKGKKRVTDHWSGYDPDKMHGAGKKPQSKASATQSYYLQGKRGVGKGKKTEKRSAAKGDRKFGKKAVVKMVLDTVFKGIANINKGR